MSASSRPIPPTPLVISPSPTPSEKSGKDGYFSRQSNGRITSPGSTQDEPEDPALARSRSRSRSPAVTKRGARRMDGMTPIAEATGAAKTRPTRQKPERQDQERKDSNVHLKPLSSGFGRDYWRALSRSPSPLGLIPIHREWRTFVHKHEIPRKALHVSIGFFAICLYMNGYQPSDIHPTLLYLFIPIFLTDVVRMNYAPFNRFYIRMLGAFMRESEAHDKYNGVISYLAGAWVVMRFCPKDVGIVSILLLSWCDTAASTFGRLYGRYTPRIARGKSLAGSTAAFVTGALATAFFYVLVAQRVPPSWSTGENGFAFDGHLTLPGRIRERFDLARSAATIEGPRALVAMSVMSGLIASISEAIDFLGFDDNLTIPIFCGLGLSAFLRSFQ